MSKKLAKPLAKLAVAGLALLLLVELIVRFAFPVPMEPAGSMTLTNDIPGVKKSVSFRFDGDHLRKIGWSKKRKSPNLRILCAGGNGTTALLQSAEDAWWGVLAADLEEKLGKPVEVASLAHLPGGRIGPGLVAVEKALDLYDVDLIIASFGFGDAYGVPGDYQRDPGELDRIRSEGQGGWKYSLAKASHLLRIVRNARRSRFLQKRQEEVKRPNFYRDYLVAANQQVMLMPVVDRFARTGDDPIEDYRDGVQGFVDLAKNKGVALLIVGEPTLYKSSLGPAEAARITVPWHPTTPKEGQSTAVRIAPLAVESELNRLYRAGAEICKAAGVPFVNLQGEIPRYGDNFVSETYLTDQGAKKVAEKLAGPAADALVGK